MVAGVTRHELGKHEVNGRTAAILELGSGFHPMFTGRQNIQLNAALLGLLEAAEIREREPDIVAWSELGEFIDRPVREYSSGMTIRLGFLDRDSGRSGDPDRRRGALGRRWLLPEEVEWIAWSRFVEYGGTLPFCSHALYLISAFCESALWLRHGQVAAFGPDRGGGAGVRG